MPEFHTEAPQATASEGLAQGPYVAVRTEFEPATLWTKGVESTNEPPLPTNHAALNRSQQTLYIAYFAQKV